MDSTEACGQPGDKLCVTAPGLCTPWGQACELRKKSAPSSPLTCTDAVHPLWTKNSSAPHVTYAAQLALAIS